MVCAIYTAVCISAQRHAQMTLIFVLYWSYAWKLYKQARLAEQLCHRSGPLLQTAMTMYVMTAAGTGGIWSRAYMGVSNCEMGLSHISAIP